MAAVALIKFTQGPNTDIGGRAVVGSLYEGVCAITNNDNTGVTSWRIDTLYSPPGSALAVGLLAAAATNTPAGNFTPDVPGSYRFKLTVHDALGGTDVDIRVFSVPFATRGLIAPPYQRDPDPLPTIASGLPGFKPNEMNFGGVELGWAGDTGADRKLMHQLIAEVDATEGLPSKSTASTKQTLQILVEDLYEPVQVVEHHGDAWVLQSNFAVTGYPGLTKFNPSTLLAGQTYYGPSVSDTFVAAASGSANIWVLCVDLGTMNTGYRIFDPVAGTYSALVPVNVGVGGRDIAVGNDRPWMISVSELYWVDLMGVVNTLVGFAGLTSIVYDGTLANYPDHRARTWIADGPVGALHRINNIGVVDGTTVLPNGQPYAITEGGGFIWALSTDIVTARLTIFKVNPNTTLVVGSSIAIDAVAPFGVPYSLKYDEDTLLLHVLVGDAGTLEPYLAAVNPTTLTVDFSGAAAAGSTAAVALTVLPRITMVNGLVCCPVAYETVPPTSAGLAIVATVAAAYTFNEMVPRRSVSFDWTKYLGEYDVATGWQLEIDAATKKIIVGSDDTLECASGGLINLPALFKVAGAAVSANVTAPNLTALTGGGDTTLHSHAVPDFWELVPTGNYTHTPPTTGTITMLHDYSLDVTQSTPVRVMDTSPVEFDDASNQLSGYLITGMTPALVDSRGRLYLSIISDGAGFYHVAFYSDSARTVLIGHSPTYNAPGNYAVVANGGSGIAGSFTVDAVIGASTAIYLEYFKWYASATCSAGTLTIVGPPLTTGTPTILAMWFDFTRKGEFLQLSVPGTYAALASVKLLEEFLHVYRGAAWIARNGRVVWFRVSHYVCGAVGLRPIVNVRVVGAATSICTSNAAAGLILAVANTEYMTVVDIDPAVYAVAAGGRLELTTSLSGDPAVDADLNVSIGIVVE